jgi:hypothetical protein
MNVSRKRNKRKTRNKKKTRMKGSGPIFVVYGTEQLEDHLKTDLRNPDFNERIKAFQSALYFTPLPQTKDTRQYRYTKQQLDKVATLASLDGFVKIRELGFKYYQIEPVWYNDNHKKALANRAQLQADCRSPSTYPAGFNGSTEKECREWAGVDTPTVHKSIMGNYYV